jgi:hypothetical protein
MIKIWNSDNFKLIHKFKGFKYYIYINEKIFNLLNKFNNKIRITIKLKS